MAEHWCLSEGKQLDSMANDLEAVRGFVVVLYRWKDAFIAAAEYESAAKARDLIEQLKLRLDFAECVEKILSAKDSQ